MNYRNENATPRDRYEAYSCANNKGSGAPTENRGSCFNNSSSAAYPRYIKKATYNNTCSADNGFVKREAPIAMVYSPVQVWRDLYDPHTALDKGTIFKELDLPFYPTPCRRKECYPCQYK